MADQTIKPLSPINRSSDVLKKKKDIERQENSKQPSKPDKNQREKKGIIDTYA